MHRTECTGPALQETLTRALGTFTISPQYLQNCLQQQAGAWEGVRVAGRKLSEASDMIMDSWERRNRSDDIIAAKRSDAMLDKERLYSEETGEVYEFDNGFYDQYRLNPERHRITDLKLLPDDRHDLWTALALDGPQHL